MNIIDRLAKKISDWIEFLRPVKHDWHIIKERSMTTEHFRRKISTGEKFGVSTVKQVTYIEQCKNTGEKRAKIVYGIGSLFPDEIIDVTKAELIIDEKI